MVSQEELEKMSPEEIAELQRQNCIFCKIIKGDVPGQTVLSTEHTHAVHDIRPSKDGHVLVMPKEHVPILPLLPPEQFKALFSDMKRVIQGVKEAKKTDKVSVFIANGPAAGQQASHFLLHVMSRDQGDVLEQHLNLPLSSQFKKYQQDMVPALKKNLPLMMKNHFQRIGGTPFSEKPLQSPSSELPESSTEKLAVDDSQQDKIAQFFEMYPQARSLLEQDVEQFKELLQKVQPEVKELFNGIDLQILSQKFQHLSSEEGSENMDFSASDVFKGSNPSGQAQQVVQYFMSKPKAKELLLSDPESFKSLLKKRDDVRPIFEDVDIDKLSQVLDKLLEGVNHDG